MTPVDTTARGQNETLTFEFELPHPPDKVWRALTDEVLLAEWLLPVTGLALEPGTAFMFQAPPQPGWDGVGDAAVARTLGFRGGPGPGVWGGALRLDDDGRTARRRAREDPMNGSMPRRPGTSSPRLRAPVAGSEGA